MITDTTLIKIMVVLAIIILICWIDNVITPRFDWNKEGQLLLWYTWKGKRYFKILLK